MSVSFTCFLDVNEDNVFEYDVSSSMLSFRFVNSMDMVARVQTDGRLEALFGSYDESFLELFKYGRGIQLRSHRATDLAAADDPPVYTGYVRTVARQGRGKFRVVADYALDWLHNDDDTATYVNFYTGAMIADVLSHSGVSAPWHQTLVNPSGRPPGTYMYGSVGDSVAGDNTLVGAYYPSVHSERSYQQMDRVDAIVLDIDSADKSGSLFSLLAKAVLSEAGYLFCFRSGGIAFRGRYGRPMFPPRGRRYFLSSWNGADYASWDERVSELTALSPNRKASADALFKTLRNFYVPPGSSFYQFESYTGADDFPVEIVGSVRLEGLPDGVTCHPSHSGFQLYLSFENAGRDLVVIEELSIYADVVDIHSVTRRLVRTGFRGGRQEVLEFANLAGKEDELLDHYVQGLQAQNELSAIYLQGAALERARMWNLMNVVDLNDGDVDESAYIRSMEWSQSAAGFSQLKLGLWPFVDYHYGVVDLTGFSRTAIRSESGLVGTAVVGI